jgi:hypothetical protein
VGSTADRKSTTISQEGVAIVLQLEFYHMGDVDCYDGWTSHIIRVSPTFDGFEIKISGKNRNNIKEYLADTYYYCLNQAIDVWADGTIDLAFDETCQVKPTRNEMDRYFQMFDPIYSGM